MITTVDPINRPRLVVLGSLMFAASKSWLPNEREVLLPLVCGLMRLTREDHCSAGAEGVVDRLLLIADHRIEIEELSRCALAEIRASPSSGGPEDPYPFPDEPPASWMDIGGRARLRRRR
jgi:hypothetical protein